MAERISFCQFYRIIEFYLHLKNHNLYYLLLVDIYISFYDIRHYNCYKSRTSQKFLPVDPW
jgi:hypothetical protein